MNLFFLFFISLRKKRNITLLHFASKLLLPKPPALRTPPFLSHRSLLRYRSAIRLFVINKITVCSSVSGNPNVCSSEVCSTDESAKDENAA